MLLDASAVLRICFEPVPRHLLSMFQVLDVAVYDAFASILTLARRGQITEVVAKHLAERLATLLNHVTIIRTTPQTIAKAMELAGSLGVNIYEAVLLYVASHTGVLVTEDPEIKEKAYKLNIKVLSLDELTKLNQEQT